MKKFTPLSFLLCCVFLFKCQSSSTNLSPPEQTTQFLDARDQHSYPIAKIGNRLWMTKNLQFQSHTIPTFQKDDPKGEKYGYYYSVNDLKEVCPTGWRIPNWSDLMDLIQYLKGESLPERSGKKVPIAALTELNLQLGGISIPTSDTLRYQAVEYMSIWHSTADTVFSFREPEKQAANGRYTIGLHIYPANQQKDL